MLVDCARLSGDQAYFLLIQTVIPRPIAWVLSDNGGSFNLAPFSFFNAIASEPPVIMLSVGWKDESTRKDTWVNIDERSDFVVHIPSPVHAGDVARSSAALPHGASELDILQVTTEPVEGFRLPRVVGPKIAFFCVKHRILEIGTAPQGLILGEVKAVWMDDSVAAEKNGRFTVDPRGVDPLTRLGGTGYATLGEILQIKRPD